MKHSGRRNVAVLGTFAGRMSEFALETVITRYSPAVVFQSCSALDADVQNRTVEHKSVRRVAKPIVCAQLQASRAGLV